MDNEKTGLSELLLQRREKLAELKSKNMDPHLVSKYERDAFSIDIKDEFEKFENQTLKLAGRIMSKRTAGKAAFFDIMDSKGRIQCYIRKDMVGDENMQEFKKLDLGDIIGIEGEVFKTKVGEVSIKVKDYTLLTKSLQVLPEKFHGLKDVDLRYRQRYLDLIVNPDVKETFVKRTKIIKKIKSVLDEKGYLEVDTPTLSSVAGGAAAKPFVTHHNTLDIDMYLRIANELYLKRLIVGGFDKVYEMGKMFRNEGMSVKHNPEFTSIELYAAYEDFNYMMDITEEIIEACQLEINSGYEIENRGEIINLKAPFRRVAMNDLVIEKTGINFYDLSIDEAKKKAKEFSIDIKPHFEIGHIINELFEELCENDLIQPTFVTHYPVEVSPLSKRSKEDSRLTDRFELFINTWEYANAFSELNDAQDQKERFLSQEAQKDSGDEEAHQMDEDFINALEIGLPPTAGLGIGVDRLVILLTGAASIRDVILFPTMKPLN